MSTTVVGIYQYMYWKFCCSQHYAGGEDFGIVSEMVTFVAQSTPGDAQCFSLTIFTDTLRESDETFSLVLPSQEVAVNPDRNELIITIEEGMHIRLLKLKLGVSYN